MIQAERVDSARQPKPPSLPEPRWETPEVRASIRAYLTSEEGRAYVAGLRDGNATVRARAERTHCKRGHRMEGSNVVWKGGYPECRECRRITDAERRARQEKPRMHGPKNIVHGASGYNQGCRCQTCADGNAERARRYRARKEAA